LNFIYRIYEVIQHQNQDYAGDAAEIRSDVVLNQEVMITDSRDSFKENMKTLYPNIKFANNGKLKNGDIYCIIISDTCYNTEQYTAIKEYECGHCHKIFKSNEKFLNRYWGTYSFKTNHITPEVLKEHEAQIKDLCFCSKQCELNHKNDIINMLEEKTIARYGGDNDFIPDVFITKDVFIDNSDGYVYKISKKSTGEFYVGQTMYVPIFRWGQHLLTERFNIQNIGDYVFEILEVIKDKNLLNQREAYWINKCRDENPELSLNIKIPKKNLQ